jgi:hypothetical protein
MATRDFTTLPIDATRGFPQSFTFFFNGRNYDFRLYIDVLAPLLADKNAVLQLPSAGAALVAVVESEQPGGVRKPILIRKIVPSLEYEAESIVLSFPDQRVAVRNINGTGEFGSLVTGRIASRWA